MTSLLVALCIDALDPGRLARFWSLRLGGQHIDIGHRPDDGHLVVWDQDQETALRSPHGGPKITWGASSSR